MKLARNVHFQSLVFSSLACLLLATVVVAQAAVTGTVYQTTNVRSGPDTRFEIVEQLSGSDQVQIDGRDDTSLWLHVITSDGKMGWLPVFALIVAGDVNSVAVIPDQGAPDGTPESTLEASAGVTVISYGRVNVRSGPGINYGIVGQLDVNDQANAVARSSQASDWLMIRFDNTNGWVAYFTVNVQGDAHTLPVLVPDSSGQVLIPPSRLLHARFNVRLHDLPDLASPLLVIVPFNSQVTPIGRSAQGDWLYVGFNNTSGWGLTQLFDISSDEVQSLPVYAQGAAATATPEATAEP